MGWNYRQIPMEEWIEEKGLTLERVIYDLGGLEISCRNLTERLREVEALPEQQQANVLPGQEVDRLNRSLRAWQVSLDELYHILGQRIEYVQAGGTLPPVPPQ